MGFTLNSYDHCIANKLINGKQCTIVWYVDNNKISHVERQVVEDIIKKIEEHFPGLVVHKEEHLDFLGMNIKFPSDGTVCIKMRQYLDESISEYGEHIHSPVSSPATKNLFDVNEDAPPLNKENQERFHSMVALLLYVAQRARPDLAPAFAFLPTRVTRSTSEDEQKLIRVLHFIKGTIADV